MLVSDLRHFLDLPDDVPTPAARLADQLRGIVRAATAGDAGADWVTALPCQRRPGHRRCSGQIRVRRTDASAPITWECTACGDSGSISGWPGAPDDLSRQSLSKAEQVENFRISDDLAASLREILVLDPDCERAVYRARVDQGRIVLSATEDELDELLGYLAAEANHESNPRRRQRLDAAYDELSNALRKPVRSTAAAKAPSGAGVGLTSVTSTRPTPSPAGLPSLDVARVQRWCAARVPDRARHQVRVECEPAARHLTIVERRAPWQEGTGQDWTSFPIARLRYAKAAQVWTLYRRDRDLRFHVCDRLPPSRHLDDLLAEIDRDPTGIFWG
jgi:hypothetical protein